MTTKLLNRFFVLVLFLFTGVLPAAAQIVVDYTGDEPDGDPDDGLCRICLQYDDDGNCVEYGPCSLRAAVEQANANAGLDQITFAVAGVAPILPLPAFTGPVVIDGGGVFVLDGSAATFSNAALHFEAPGNTLRNIEIRNWQGDGATFRAGNNLVENVYIHDNGRNGQDGGLDFRDGAGNQILGSRIERNGGEGELATGDGILLTNVQDTEVRDCSILHNRGAGIVAGDMFGDRPPGIISNITIVDNVISANSRGIDLMGIDGGGETLIQNNIIGPDAAGTGFLQNAFTGRMQSIGVDVDHGGGQEAVRILDNTISGNRTTGVVSDENTFVYGNYIGTDITGREALPNGSEGVAGSGTIGGAEPGQGNVISGNGNPGGRYGDGINASDGATVAGNVIGLDVDGNPLPNQRAGVGIFYEIEDVTVRDNVIAANLLHGLWLYGTDANGRPEGTVVASNFIGIADDGISARPNGGAGLQIEGAINSTIGGEGEEDGNVIAYNEGTGVRVVDGTGNAVVGNRIFNNTGLGIDLGEAGVTPNDAMDEDDGPNGLQNFPVIVTEEEGGSTAVRGVLRSAPGTEYRVEFFGNNIAEDDPPQGETVLGSTTVTTDEEGLATFETTLDGAWSDVTATATDPDGNTSEFSPGAADVYVEKFDVPDDTVAVGDTLTYRLLVGNAGPNAAQDVVVRDPLPETVDVLSVDASPGPRASGVECEQDGQEVTCTIASLDVTGPQEQVLITVEVVPQQAGTLENTATVVGSAPGDPVPENDQSATVLTEVTGQADLEVSMESSAGSSAEVGSVVTYTITTGNLGPEVSDEVTLDIYIDPEVSTFWNITWENEETSCELSEEMPQSKATCIMNEFGSGDTREVEVKTGVHTDAAGRTSTTTATVTGGGTATDPNDENNSNTIEIAVEEPTATTDLKVDKTADMEAVKNGDVLVYTVTVTNDGFTDAHNVVVTEFPPVSPFYSSVEIQWKNIETDKGTCDQRLSDGVTGLFFECRLGTLTALEEVTIRIPMTVALDENDALPPDSLFNEVVANSDTPDENLDNNKSEAQVALRGPLEVVKEGPDSGFIRELGYVGIPITFTITVINHGAVEAPDVVVRDELPHEAWPRLGSYLALLRHVRSDEECTAERLQGIEGFREIVTCELGTLAPQEMRHVQVVTIPTRVGNVQNVATATSSDGRSGEDDALVSVELLPDDDTGPRMNIFEYFFAAFGGSGGPGKRTSELASSVDIYVDSVLVVNDVAPGEASGPRPFPLRRTTIRVDVVEGTVPDNNAPILSQDVDLLSGDGAALHLSDRTAFLLAGSPTGEVVGLLPKHDVRWQAADPAQVDLFAAHAATQVPAVGVYLLDDPPDHRVVETLVDSLGFGDVTDYTELEPGSHDIEVVDSETGETLDVFRIDLAERGGEALALVLAGNAEGGLTLSAIDSTGTRTDATVVTATVPPADVPQAFALHAAYPNPFTTSVTLPFDVSAPTHVRLAVYDVLGREVAVLVDEAHAPGRHRATFDARRLPAGTYFYTIEMGDFRAVRKLVHVR